MAEEQKNPTYRDLGFDENLRRIIVERQQYVNSNEFDSYFEIGEGNVTSDNMADGSVDADAIMDLAIEARNIASGAISEVKIEANAITAGKIAAGAVGANQIAANAVIAEKIAASAVIAEKIAASAIIAEKIGTNEIIANTANIKDGVITSAKIISLNADVITAGTITGRTVRTAIPAAGVGESVVIEGGSSKYVQFYYNADLVGYIRGYTTEGAEVTYVEISAASGRKIKLKNSYIEFNGSIAPNSDNAHQCGTDSLRWSKGWFEDISVDDITINAGGSITVAGNSGDDKEFEVGTSFREDGGNYQWKARLLTFKKGVLTNLGGESGWRTMD